jgi:hypothetical protein
MTTSTIYIHIGAGKAGSSALQSFFSNNHTLKTTSKRTVKYYALKTESVLFGDTLKESSIKSFFEYESSVAISAYKKPEQLKKQLKHIDNLCLKNNHDVIVSCEDYINHPQYFDENRIFTHLESNIQVIMYIRPPLDWLNSAYWQWGAWTNIPFEKWFKASCQKILWYDIYSMWIEVKGVDKLSVRLSTTDVIDDIKNLLSLSPIDNATKQSNKSTGDDLLRFLLRNRNYRPNAHDPTYEFFLNSKINFTSKKAPWVIGPTMQNYAFDYLGNNYKNFEKVLPKNLWQEMDNNESWWNNSLYLGRGHAEKTLSDLESADRVISDMIEAFIKMDKENT